MHKRDGRIASTEVDIAQLHGRTRGSNSGDGAPFCTAVPSWSISKPNSKATSRTASPTDELAVKRRFPPASTNAANELLFRCAPNAAKR